jgi:hypothetical protein
MTDTELVAATLPPPQLADAFLRQAEADVEVLLDLFFACHQLVDDPEQEDGYWYDCSHAWPIRSLYIECKAPQALPSVAPTWADAIKVSEQWLKLWRHDCGDFDYWAYRRDELDDPPAISYFRSLMVDRIPASN